MTVTTAGLIIAGAATLILINRRFLSKAEVITSVRIDRAISGTKAPSASPDHLPSIVRNRYASFRRGDRIKSALFRPIIGLNKSLELLGVQIPLGIGVTSFFSVVLVFGLSVHIALPLGLFLSFFLSSSFLICMCYLCVAIARNKMIAKFQRLFPDALDLVVRSVRAGLPVSEAIKMISAEVPNPVGAAFGEVGSSISIGVNLNNALDQLAAKVQIAELRFFAISLSVQQETGGNLAEILSNLSKLMRKRVQVKKKIRALSSEARASALIIGSLPFIVSAAIFFLNRSYIEVLVFDDDGRFLALCALASIATGGVIMAKLIRFKI